MRKKQIWIRTEEAIKHYGTSTQLATVLGVTISAVSQYGEFLPDSRAWQLQNMTGNALTMTDCEPA